MTEKLGVSGGLTEKMVFGQGPDDNKEPARSSDFGNSLQPEEVTYTLKGLREKGVSMCEKPKDVK